MAGDKSSYFGEEDIGKRNPNSKPNSSVADPTAKSDAASVLNNAEQSHTSSSQKNVHNQSSASKSESNPGFKSNTVGQFKDARDVAAYGNHKQIVSTFMKKKGPVGFIIGAILLVNFFVFSVPGGLPFATLERFSELYNTLKYSNVARSDKFALKFMNSFNKNKVNQAGFFGKKGDSVTSKRLGVTRSRTIDANKSFTENAQPPKDTNTSSNNSSKDTTNSETNESTPIKNGQEINEIGPDGNPTGKKITVDQLDGDLDIPPGSDVNVATNKLRAAAIASAVATGANVVCGIFAAVGTIQVVASTIRIMNLRNLFTGYAQMVDQIKAGDGNQPGVADMNSEYNRKMVEPVADLSDPNNPDLKTIAVSSESAKKVYNNQPMDLNNPSVQSLNMAVPMDGPFGEVLASINGFSNAAKLFRDCAYIKAASGIVQLVVAFIPGGAAATSLTKTLVRAGTSFMISAGISALISFVIPKIAQSLVRDFIGNMGGNAMFDGMNLAAEDSFGVFSQNYGNGPGSPAKLSEFKQEQNRLVALEAAQIRATKSPFDTSTTHTFLGSLLYGNLAIAANISSPVSLISSLTTSLYSSVSSLLPGAYASTNNTFMTPNNCEILQAIGAVGNEYCMPSMITDMALNDADPDAIVQHLADTGGLIITPKENSPSTYLASTNPTSSATFAAFGDSNVQLGQGYKEYIGFCSLRDAPFGFADAGSAQKFNVINTSNGTADNLLSAGLNSVPILGDIANVFDGLNEAAHAGLITGEDCVVSDNNSRWSEFKYYQRNMLDLNLAENTGALSRANNPVASFIDEYYQQNPIDESYEGTIARLSGLTKETVIATLNLVDEYNFIANYDPSGLGPIVNRTKTEPIFFDIEDTTPILSNIAFNIVYQPLRNRTYTV